MASIRDYAFTEGTVASSTPVADMPIHFSGDLLLAFHQADAVTINLPSGWEDVVQINGSGHGCRAFYKIASSSSETLTGSQSGSDTYTIIVLTIKDFDPTTPLNGFTTRTTDDSAVPHDGVDITTTSDNCLVFSYLSCDGGRGPTCEPGWTNLVTGDAGANSGGLAYTVKKTAGLLNAPSWYAQINDNSTSITVAINDDGNLSSLPAYILPGDSPGSFIEHGYWVTGGVANAWGNSYPTSLSHATIGAKSTAYDSSAVTGDTGVNPYWGSQYLTPVASTNGSTLGGSECQYSSAVDYSGKILLTSYLFATPRDYVDLSTSTDSGQYGLVWVASDGTNYKAWTIGTKGDQTTKADARVYAAIQVDQTTSTTIASSGSLSSSSIDRHLCLAQGRYGAVSYRHSCFFLADEFTVCGGTTSENLNFGNLEQVLNNSLGNFPIMIREGSAATFLAPIKIGGTDPVHINVNLRTLQFRKTSDGVDYFDWHVDDNKCGFEFDGQANDTISFTNCVFTSGSTTYWRFSSDFSSSCNHNFSGTNVINNTVTLRSSVTLNNVGFIDCSQFTQNSATLNNCNFQNTKIMSDDVSKITSCSFTSSGTGHAIEITDNSGSPYTFSGNTFNGYGGAESTDSAIYNNSGGDIIINITGGGDTPTVRNGAGATTTINNAVNIRITVKDEAGFIVENARVGVYKVSDDSEIMNELSTSEGVAEVSFNYESDTDVYIRVRKASTGDTKYYVYSSSDTITSSGLTSTITLIEDPIA